MQLLVALCIAAVGFVIHRDVLRAEILGYDSYALIVSSRIESLGDFLGTFSETMMDGRLDAGDFYRPVANLGLAFDYSVWGLDPFGYQLTNLLVFCAGVVALHALARRVLGRGAWLGPGVGALFYALHPAALSALPYPARRPETLWLLFAACALAVLPDAPSRGAWRRQLLAGTIAALALGSKESGVIVLGLIGVHQLLFSPGGAAARFQSALRATAIAAGPVAVVLLARIAVIGGLGGYAMSIEESYGERFLAWAPNYVTAALMSQPSGSLALDRWLPLSAGVGLVLLSLVFGASRLGRVDERSRRASALFTVAGAWLVAQLFLVANSVHFTYRYAPAIVFPIALLVAALVEASWLCAGRRDRTSRIWAGVAGLTLLLVIPPALSGSALLRTYPGMDRASRAQRQTLVALELAIPVAREGELLRVDLRRSIPVESRIVDSFWLMAHWGLQGWLDMNFPDRRYEVRVQQRPGVPHDSFAATTLYPYALPSRGGVDGER